MTFFAFFMGAAANDQCPDQDSHELSAVRYKMFTAYQTAYDGYQAPCEIKCFDKENCTNQCQQNKALESLAQHMQKELTNRGINTCTTISKICTEQCQDSGEPCEKACRG